MSQEGVLLIDQINTYLHCVMLFLVLQNNGLVYSSADYEIDKKS